MATKTTSNPFFSFFVRALGFYLIILFAGIGTATGQERSERISCGTQADFFLYYTKITGRILETHPATAEREIQLNTTAYPDGVYFLKFENAYGNVTKKLIIKN